jgi:hypothetical protein
MKIEPVRWQNRDAVRWRAHECEMVVGVSDGPRILSLRRRAGSNLFYHDTTDFRVGEWRLLPPTYVLHDWQDIGAQAGCIPGASIAQHAP